MLIKKRKTGGFSRLATGGFTVPLSASRVLWRVHTGKGVGGALATATKAQGPGPMAQTWHSVPICLLQEPNFCKGSGDSERGQAWPSAPGKAFPGCP